MEKLWKKRKYLAVYAVNFLNLVLPANPIQIHLHGVILHVQENVQPTISAKLLNTVNRKKQTISTKIRRWKQLLFI